VKKTRIQKINPKNFHQHVGKLCPSITKKWITRVSKFTETEIQKLMKKELDEGGFRANHDKIIHPIDDQELLNWLVKFNALKVLRESFEQLVNEIDEQLIIEWNKAPLKPDLSGKLFKIDTSIMAICELKGQEYIDTFQKIASIVKYLSESAYEKELDDIVENRLDDHYRINELLYELPITYGFVRGLCWFLLEFQEQGTEILQRIIDEPSNANQELEEFLQKEGNKYDEEIYHPEQSAFYAVKLLAKIAGEASRLSLLRKKHK